MHCSARILCLVGASLAAAPATAYDTTDRSEAMLVFQLPLGGSSRAERAPSFGLEFSARDRDQHRRGRLNRHWFDFDRAEPDFDSGFRLDLDFER